MTNLVNGHRGPIALAMLLLVSGCDMAHPPTTPPARFSTETLFGHLHRVVHAARTDVGTMDLVDECTMRIQWADGVVRTYDLMRLRTAFPDHDDGERYTLLVENRATGTQRVLVATSHWGEFMMARSSIGHLRGLCALSRHPPEPASATG